jgi:hypothetical protein
MSSHKSPEAGLPDDIFAYLKSQFGYRYVGGPWKWILLVYTYIYKYSMPISNISRPFGIFYCLPV